MFAVVRLVCDRQTNKSSFILPGSFMHHSRMERSCKEPRFANNDPVEGQDKEATEVTEAPEKATPFNTVKDS